MVESLEKEVVDHKLNKQDDSIWGKAIAVIFAIGLSVSAAYLVHEFACSSQYQKLQQDIHTYFYKGYNIR